MAQTAKLGLLSKDTSMKINHFSIFFLFFFKNLEVFLFFNNALSFATRHIFVFFFVCFLCCVCVCVFLTVDLVGIQLTLNQIQLESVCSPHQTFTTTLKIEEFPPITHHLAVEVATVGVGEDGGAEE